MNHLMCFLLMICAVTANENSDSVSITAKIQVVEKADDFILANPGSLGERVDEDRIVGVARGSANWMSPQNAQHVLNYPANVGHGAVVSFFSVFVDQSSNLSNGFIINGGIGQRHITILIEATNTFYFNYVAEIYGL
ncbi:hypothetical protein DMENIID0001_169780 [Sergentomyia squamirostris]